MGDMLHGDMSALPAFYSHTVGSVTAQAVALAGSWDDANEIVRGVYEQAFHHLASYDPSLGSVLAWLSGYARDVAAQRKRRGVVSFPAIHRSLGSPPM
jgi:DNA-directed RNA polymerase specialized sigma24 family protein